MKILLRSISGRLLGWIKTLFCLHFVYLYTFNNACSLAHRIKILKHVYICESSCSGLSDDAVVVGWVGCSCSGLSDDAVVVGWVGCSIWLLHEIQRWLLLICFIRLQFMHEKKLILHSFQWWWWCWQWWWLWFIFRLHRRINVASVDLESNGKLEKRFKITHCPTFILWVWYSSTGHFCVKIIEI